MLMPDRQAVLRDAVDQLLDAVGRGEVRSPSDCVRVLREMTEPRPCAGCGQPRVEPQALTASALLQALGVVDGREVTP